MYSILLLLLNAYYNFFIEMCDFLCGFVVMGSDIVGITIKVYFFFVFWIDDVYNKNKEKIICLNEILLRVVFRLKIK